MKSFSFTFVFTASAFSISAFDIMLGSGKAGYTGSPGETYCTTCHSGTPLNGGGGSISITGAPLPYIPGLTYTISVTVSQPGRSLFGFGFEALSGSNNNAGTLTITNPAETQLLTALNGRINVTHVISGGATPNSHTFTFNWTAPSTDIGPVIFYAAGNAADGNAQSSGDLIYSTSAMILSPAGVAEDENSISINVFPNPVHDFISIKYLLEAPGRAGVKIYSADGRKIFDFPEDMQGAGMHIQKLALPNYISPGIYFLLFSVDGKASVKKIIVE